MHIALVTCSAFPDGGLDDRPLMLALRQRGAAVSTPAWDDPDVDWARFDAVLLRSTWDYPTRRDAFLAWAAAVDGVTTLLSPPALLRWNSHKSYLVELAQAGVPTTPTRLLTEAPADLAALLSSPDAAFCKPAIGLNSEGTRRLTGTPEDVAWVEGLIAAGGALLQPYRAAVETTGEISVILIDGEISHGVRKWPQAGDYRVQEGYGAHDGPHPITEAEAAVVRAAAGTVIAHAPLVMRIDLLHSPDGPEVCEVELIEPCLFFRHHLPAAQTLADALLRRIGVTPAPVTLPPPWWRAVVFDLDGTVLNSADIVVAAFNGAREAEGLDPVDPDRIRAGIGLPLRGMVAMLCDPGDDVDAVTAGYKANYIRLAPIHEAAFAGMKELIVDLAARGVALGVATGKSQYGADNAGRRHNLRHWIPAIHGILPGTPGKPHPAVLQRALADLGVAADEAVFIGDTTYDMNLADAIDVDAIGVTWGVHSPRQLEETGALAVVDTVAQLRALLLPG